jgi:arylsulfatase A-like enzyme
MYRSNGKSPSRILRAGLAALAVSCHPSTESLRGSCADCNVVLISVDTLRADHLGAYGYTKPTSPFIDSLADDSVLFQRAFTPRGLTRPSVVSMLTSLYPVASGVRTMKAKLSQSIPTLASLLEAHGYSTVSFLSGPVARFRDLGFQEAFSGDDAQITDFAKYWLDRNQQKKFFLWIHYFSPHDDYQPPAEFDRFTEPDYDGAYDGSREQLMHVAIHQIELDERDHRHIIGLYDGEIAYVDSLIREFYTVLKNMVLLEKSIVIFVGDHGEDLYQHNRYFQHMYSTYDSSLRIPLLLKLPGGHVRKRVDSIVEIIDIAPTILELIDQPVPPEFAGRSLLPLLDGTSDEAFDHALSELSTEAGPGEILSIRTDRWRYVDNPTEKIPKGLPGHHFYTLEREELYDLQEDPDEFTNVVDQFPEVASSLRERLRSAYHAQPEGQAQGQVDAETMEQLRALGYVP